MRTGKGKMGRTDFNPRAPRGARPARHRPAAVDRAISIHALREERDPFVDCVGIAIDISIHALREERDGFYG